ncbi:aminoglycoside phosphotransferase family protein [Crossiella sp. CA-258035]|uniref:aminoglycoside phosphotransferase family protein n=1 Tax=Crossiella sp. CA-258035 TaxID=2981138 RepID=UPI0024BD4C92|nr:aminoglycoside phosphotransferase family protein [Crossiella sp. CA-258035]WHT17344.1 aminoglycoside phosphotransferase family protein [Crossiella sp. CA-258035]
MSQPAPAATGRRRAWSEVTAPLRAAVEHFLGAPVTEAVSQTGGFSPGVAARLRLADGRRVFVKAVDWHTNRFSAPMHRAEAIVSSGLSTMAPVPELLASFDQDGWTLLLFADIDGRQPSVPWLAGELDRVLAAVAELAGALTPCPLDVPTAQEKFAHNFTGWRRLAAEPDDRLDPWTRRNLDRLAELESHWPGAAAGNTLLHGDLRADNLLLTEDRVVVVDWPHACRGAAWIDLLALLPSVRMQGGPELDPVFLAHPVAATADPDAVNAVLAGLAGYFVRGALQPDPPGLPTLRAFQGAQGVTAVEWLRGRLGWS